MIGVNKSTLPYQQKLNYPMIKYIRLCRNMSQESFGAACAIDQSVLAKLERNELQLSPHYESKVLEGCRNLNISELELLSVKRLTELKEQKLKAHN